MARAARVVAAVVLVIGLAGCERSIVLGTSSAATPKAYPFASNVPAAGSSLVVTSDLTVDTWVRASGATGVDEPCASPTATSLVGISGTGWFKGQFPVSVLNRWRLGIAADGDLWFAAQPREVSAPVLTTPPPIAAPVCADLAGSGLRDGVWHHVAAERTLAGDVSLWVDGVRRATGISGAGRFDQPTNNPGQIGEIRSFGVTPTTSCSGCTIEVDELRLSSGLRWDATFTPSRSAYASDAATLALWHFDRVDGGKVLDASPHGNALTLAPVGPGTGDGLSNGSPFTD